MALLLLFLGLVLFVSLVVLHELGHFIAARRNDVEVEEFGIGFPPKAKVLGKKKGTVYTLNWLPLGGFVKLKGENDADTAKGSYGAAPLRAKILIMTAGVVVNLLVAFVMLTGAAAIGIPKILPNQFTVEKDTKIVRQDVYIGFVEEGSPAAEAGIEAQDRLISMTHEGQTVQVNRPEDLPGFTEQLAGQSVQVNLKRDGVEKYAFVTLRSLDEVEASKNTDTPKGYLGVSPTDYTLQRSTWSAPIVAAGLIKQFTVETFKGLGSAVSNLFRGNTAKATEQVSGPVGVFVLLRDGSVLGVEFILFLIAIISLTLAIMNILPIPALDGGRLFVTLFFRLIRKPLTKDIEDKIHGVGFMALMLLFVLITIVDVRRFF
jgi:regulator of sigma E protease